MFIETPFLLRPIYGWGIPPAASLFLSVEKWLLIILLGVLILGYRIRFTAALSALLLAHLGVVRYTLQWSGETSALFIGVYFLIFFALYAEEDELSLDGVRRTKNETLDDLRAYLKSTKERSYNLSALKWSLVTVGLIYFGAGFDKVFPGPRFGFATAENLSRIIIIYYTFYNQPYDFTLSLVEYPWLMEVAAWGTLVLELGFLLTILLGVTITPIVLRIYAFQTGIALSLGILFTDVYPILALFVAWDSIYKRLVRDRTIDLVFDEHCYFCARSLYLSKLLDINNTVNFYSQYDTPMSTNKMRT